MEETKRKVLQFSFTRNMDAYIIKKLGEYMITLEENRNNARGSKLKYDLILNIGRNGIIEAETIVADSYVPEYDEEVIKIRGSNTCLDNLPSKLNLMGIQAKLVYAKNMYRNLLF